MEWQKQNDERQAAWDASQVTIQERHIRNEEKKTEVAALAEETRIMTMDMSTLTPNSKKYITKRKAAIMRRYADENEDEEVDPTYANCYRPPFDY